MIDIELLGKIRYSGMIDFVYAIMELIVCPFSIRVDKAGGILNTCKSNRSQ